MGVAWGGAALLGPYSRYSQCPIGSRLQTKNYSTICPSPHIKYRLNPSLQLLDCDKKTTK